MTAELLGIGTGAVGLTEADKAQLVDRTVRHVCRVHVRTLHTDKSVSVDEYTLTGPSTPEEAFRSRVQRLRNQGRKHQTDDRYLTVWWGQRETAAGLWQTTTLTYTDTEAGDDR